jgi:hypothetical protein
MLCLTQTYHPLLSLPFPSQKFIFSFFGHSLFRQLARYFKKYFSLLTLFFSSDWVGSAHYYYLHLIWFVTFRSLKIFHKIYDNYRSKIKLCNWLFLVEFIHFNVEEPTVALLKILIQRTKSKSTIQEIRKFYPKCPV